jgi:hypothetical protein
VASAKASPAAAPAAIGANGDGEVAARVGDPTTPAAVFVAATWDLSAVATAAAAAAAAAAAITATAVGGIGGVGGGWLPAGGKPAPTAWGSAAARGAGFRCVGLAASLMAAAKAEGLLLAVPPAAPVGGEDAGF